VVLAALAVTQVFQDTQVYLVILVIPVPKAQLVIKATKVTKAPLARKVIKVYKELLVTLA